MTKFALYVPLEAKPGKEKEVADFLRSAVPLVNAEPGTISIVCDSGRTILFRDI
jgi:quinol monooxygenase YgiN